MALEYISNGQAWMGEPIGGVRHPPNIEFLWSTVELAAIGLRVTPPVEPVILLADIKAQRIAEAWAEHNARFAEAVVNVTVGGVSRPYGCDAVGAANEPAKRCSAICRQQPQTYCRRFRR